MKKYMRMLVFLMALFIGCFGVKAATLSNGTYYIESALNGNFVLDLRGGKTYNGNNIQLYESFKENANQQWKVEKLNNGYYKLTTVLSNSMSLDVYGSLRKKGTNVQLYKSNNSYAQQWLLQDAGGGYYYIMSRCNNLYIDIRGGSAYSGSNIQMYSGNRSKAQKFRFIPVLKKEKTLEDGNYIISPIVNKSNVIDSANSNITNGTNIRSYQKTGAWSQTWAIKHINRGYYSITSSLSDGASLDVGGGMRKPGTNVQMYQSNTTMAQRWIIKDNKDGTYSIVSGLGHDNLSLDVYGGSKVSGANIQVYTTNNAQAQKFVFTKTDIVPVKTGLYTITNSQTNKKLTIVDDLLSNTNNIVYSDANNSNGQKWYFKYVGNNYYSILSGFNQGFSLDIKNRGTEDGTNLQLYVNYSYPNQLWKIEYIDGKYIMSDKNSSLTIDIGDDLDNGDSNTVGKSLTKNESQQHILEPTKLNDGLPNYNDAEIATGYYYINSALNSKMSIDLSGGSRLNGSNIQLYSTGATMNQLWRINKLSDGYYSITSSLNTSTSFDVKGASNQPGTNIQLHKVNGSNAQKWIIKDVGGGYYTFVSKLGSLAIDVSSTKPVNRTNIYSNKLKYSQGQKFTLKKYTNKKVYKGIDISSWQRNIDWKKLAQTKIGFVVIRAGFGGDSSSQDDYKFQEYIKGCETYNIPYAIYLYSYADQYKYATDEANHTLRQLKSIENKNYSPSLNTKVFYDMEDDSMVKAGKTTLTQIADKYCSTLQSKGYKCGIYANSTWYKKYLDTKTLANKYTIWLAEWPKNNTITAYSTAANMRPSYNLTGYKYWQFSSNGTINGITTRVDFDLGYDIFD